MSQRKLEVVAEPGSPRLLMRRSFDAKRELIFDAFTKPEIITRWKSPPQFEVLSVALDLRVGGKWSINYRMPNGAELALHGEYSEVVRPERVVRTFCIAGKPGHMTETYTFEDRNGETLVTTISDYESVEARDAALGNATGGGMETCYERLEAMLAT